MHFWEVLGPPQMSKVDDLQTGNSSLYKEGSVKTKKERGSTSYSIVAKGLLTAFPDHQ